MFFIESRYPRGHFMEYSMDIPKTSLEKGEPYPVMFMRYGESEGSYPDYQNGYRRSKPSYRSLDNDWRDNRQIPPFPFTLPYQYVDKPYETSNPPPYRSLPTRNRNSFRSYPWRSNEEAYRPLQPFYNERYGHDNIRRHPKSVPEFHSKVDEIEANIFSMMSSLRRPFESSSSFPSNMRGSGYSTESQYGYQLLLV